MVVLLFDDADPVEDDEEEAAEVDLPLSEKVLDDEDVEEDPETTEPAGHAVMDATLGIGTAADADAGPSLCGTAVNGVVTACEAPGAEMDDDAVLEDD